MSRLAFDHTFRRVPGGWTWWRVFVEVSPLRGSFEDGNGWTYAGVVHRWARRLGPVNVALLRLIGPDDEPYRAASPTPVPPSSTGRPR